MKQADVNESGRRVRLAGRKGWYTLHGEGSKNARVSPEASPLKHLAGASSLVPATEIVERSPLPLLRPRWRHRWQDYPDVVRVNGFQFEFALVEAGQSNSRVIARGNAGDLTGISFVVPNSAITPVTRTAARMHVSPGGQTFLDLPVRTPLKVPSGGEIDILPLGPSGFVLVPAHTRVQVTQTGSEFVVRFG